MSGNERNCLSKWMNRTVLISGTIDRTTLNQKDEENKLHFCLKEVKVSEYGSGKIEEIDHIWIYSDLVFSDICLFGKLEDGFQMKLDDLIREENANPRNIVLSRDRKELYTVMKGRIGMYFRKSIGKYDYGITDIKINEGEMFRCDKLLLAFQELLRVEKLIGGLDKKRSKKFRNITEVLLKQYHALINFQCPTEDGRSISIEDWFKSLLIKLKREDIVFEPEYTVENVQLQIQTMLDIYETLYRSYKNHLRYSPVHPRKKKKLKEPPLAFKGFDKHLAVS